jgi:outer membrane protein OmpA-like peptidoglycan-associated protein
MPDNLLKYNVLLLTTVVATLAGVSFGYTLAAYRPTVAVRVEPLAVTLQGPVELHVSGVPPLGHEIVPSVSPGVGEALLGLLGSQALAALDSASARAADVSKIPVLAAEEFIKGLSGEGGKKIVDFFEYLVKLPFKRSGDAKKDQQAFTMMFVREIIREVPGTAAQPISSAVLNDRVLFATNKANLTKDAYDTIARVRVFAQDNPAFLVLLSANADTIGPSGRNEVLARQRAVAVRNALISGGGVASSRVFIAELADEALPVITPRGMSEERNRSVSIEVRR